MIINSPSARPLQTYYLISFGGTHSGIFPHSNFGAWNASFATCGTMSVYIAGTKSTCATTAGLGFAFAAAKSGLPGWTAVARPEVLVVVARGCGAGAPKADGCADAPPNAEVGWDGRPKADVGCEGAPKAEVDCAGAPNAEVSCVGAPKADAGCAGAPNADVACAGVPNADCG